MAKKKNKYIPTRDMYANHKYTQEVLDGITDSVEREMFTTLNTALDNTRRQLLKLAEKGYLKKTEMQKYHRLKGLEASLAGTWSEAFKASDKLVDKLSRIQYEESFYRAAWNIDQYSGVMLNWGQLDTNTIREAIKNDYSKIALEGMKDNGMLGIRRTIISGLAQERTYPQMTKELKKYIERTASGYQTILRTEGQRARQLGQQAFDEDAQKKGYKFEIEWLATLDEKTRESHQLMDGRTRTVDGYFKCEFVYSGKVKGPLQSGSAGFDINCRCTTLEKPKGLPDLVRRSREQGVIPAMSYEKWAGIRPKTPKAKPVGVKK
jgi:hypothetical protein